MTGTCTSITNKIGGYDWRKKRRGKGTKGTKKNATRQVTWINSYGKRTSRRSGRNTTRKNK